LSVIAQYAPDGQRQAWYTQSLARIDEVLNYTDDAGTKSWYQADALGSVYALTSSSGALVATTNYDVFGALVPAPSGPAGQPFGFTGREHELDSGLTYYRDRYMQAALGRWTQADRLGFVDGPNTYLYVLAEPTGHTDWSGRDIAVIENGPTDGNPIGHTAIAVSFNGVYSFGNDTPPGSSLRKYLVREAPRRSTAVYVIKAAPYQDEMAVLYLVRQVDLRIPLGIFSDNCSSRSNAALDWADIRVRAVTSSLPGTAGERARAVGASEYQIPKGSTFIPQELEQFEPMGGPICAAGDGSCF
jgi:RHS repeat-associated protein